MVFAGVLGGQFQKGKLISLHRHNVAHARHFHIRLERHYDLFGEAAELALYLGYELAQHRILLLLDVHPEAKVEALDDGSAAQAQEGTEGLGAVEHQGEHVRLEVAHGGDYAAGVVLLEGVYAVFPHLGLLEIEGLRGRQHAGFILLGDSAHAALQEGHYLLYPSAVFLRGHLAHTAAPALADVEIQAWAYLPAEDGISIYLVPAAAQGVVLFEEFQQVASMHHGAVGPEVAGSVLLHAPREEHPRVGFGGYADPGVGLAVLEEDVVAGLILLDEVVLQQEGV